MVDTNKNVSTILFEISKDKFGVDRNTTQKIENTIKFGIDRLQAQSKNTLEANTITFLFQIFTILIVTVGIYILVSSREDLKKTNDHINEIGNLLSNMPMRENLLNRLTYTQSLIEIIKSSGIDSLNRLIPLMRDILKETYHFFATADFPALIDKKDQDYLYREIIEIDQGIDYLIQDEAYQDFKVALENIKSYCTESISLFESKRLFKNYH